jgi:DNA-binding MarR family transcriptional regulator
VVELIDRAVDAGLVERRRDGDDQRIVHLLLTPLGAERVEELSRLHLEELRNLPRWPEEK